MAAKGKSGGGKDSGKSSGGKGGGKSKTVKDEHGDTFCGKDGFLLKGKSGKDYSKSEQHSIWHGK